MPTNPINLPAGYAPAFAIGYSDQDGSLAVVDGAKPLPVQYVSQAASAALSGSTSSSLIAGPFHPASGRPVVITLAGTWVGSVTLKRSIDDGATLYPLTIAGAAWGRFTAPACEPVWTEEENGVALFLDIVRSSGTITYRLSQ